MKTFEDYSSYALYHCRDNVLKGQAHRENMTLAELNGYDLFSKNKQQRVFNKLDCNEPLANVEFCYLQKSIELQACQASHYLASQNIKNIYLEGLYLVGFAGLLTKADDQLDASHDLSILYQNIHDVYRHDYHEEIDPKLVDCIIGIGARQALLKLRDNGSSMVRMNEELEVFPIDSAVFQKMTAK